MGCIMGTAMTKVEPGGWTPEQVDLVKKTVARGASDDELKLFLYTCQRTGLDPFAKQAYCLSRRENVDGQWVNKMTFQTGIDGYRLIAERTGRYAPGRKPAYEYRDGQLLSATAYVKKQTADGTWHETEAEAFYSEYVALKKDGHPNKMWAEKPHIMLAKCAEALALRRAFPAELSGIYTTDEMGRHNEEHDAEFAPKPPARHALPEPQAPGKPPPAQQPPKGVQPPANGLELRQRLGDFDAKLAAEKKISKGELLAHISRAGTDQGWSDDLSSWNDAEQIDFAIAETKRFVASRQKPANGQADPERPSARDPDGVRLENWLRKLGKQAHRDGLTTNEDDLLEHIRKLGLEEDLPRQVADYHGQQIEAAVAIAEGWLRELRLKTQEPAEAAA